MTYINQIIGFDRAKEDASSRNSQFIISETVRVETTSAVVRAAQVVSELPIYGAPGTLAFNPCGLTFTIGKSRHPDNANFVLESLDGMSLEGDDSHVYAINITYAEPIPWTISFDNASQRKDQKVKKPDAVDPADEVVIVDPTERPAVFTRRSKPYIRQSRFDFNGNIIKHTNGLPVTKPVPLLAVNAAYSWSWYILATAYSEKEFVDMENKCNSDTLTIQQGNGASYVFSPEIIKCVSITANEEWQTPTGATSTFHVVKITASFEAFDTELTDTWNTPPISLHTIKRTPGGLMLPIDINARGDKAQEPWPLYPNGDAIDYIDIDIAIPSDFGRLQADGADLVPCVPKVFQTFFDKYDLDMPRIRA